MNCHDDTGTSARYGTYALGFESGNEMVESIEFSTC